VLGSVMMGKNNKVFVFIAPPFTEASLRSQAMLEKPQSLWTGGVKNVSMGLTGSLNMSFLFFMWQGLKFFE